MCKNLSKKDFFYELKLRNGSTLSVLKVKGKDVWKAQLDWVESDELDLTPFLLCRVCYIDGLPIDRTQLGELDIADYLKVCEIVGSVMKPWMDELSRETVNDSNT